MCGIFGGVGVEAVAPATWEAMARALAHRGPDGVAVARRQGAVLGLTRLAIVGAREPARVFAHGDLASVLNGELYNHRALRRGLAVPGASDAAVLPALFARDGADFVHALEGPFAFALHDQGTRQLHLVRDRLGKKPLYFATLGRAVYFASEQKALTRLPGFSARVDQAVAARFLRDGVLDDHQLLFSGLERVAPGEWVTVHQGGRVERRTWWSLEAQLHRRAPPHPLERLGKALRRAVTERLPDEVPWALLLSGGLDSTLVGAAAGRALTQAFCMEAPAAGDARLARAAARRLGVRLEVVPLPEPDLEQFERALFHLEQPDAFSAWAMAPALLHLGRAVRAGGARVALMGEGADELFLGYSWDLLQAGLERGDEEPPADAVRLLGPRAARFGLHHAHARLFAAHPRARQVWLETASSTLGGPGPEEEVGGAWAGARRRQLVGLRFDMLTLPVLHADRLLMASGVEARLPFLDHRLVELALRLAPRDLERAGLDKPLLRELSRRWLPGWKAPPKKGFSAPAAPPLRLLHAQRAHLARGASLTVERSFWERARGWRAPLRAQALWRQVVLETSARVLAG